MSVLSEHIDQMWGVNHVGGLWYRTEMTSAVPAGKTVVGKYIKEDLGYKTCPGLICDYNIFISCKLKVKMVSTIRYTTDTA